MHPFDGLRAGLEGCQHAGETDGGERARAGTPPGSM
jgi:hypothetical protein